MLSPSCIYFSSLALIDAVSAASASLVAATCDLDNSPYLAFNSSILFLVSSNASDPRSIPDASFSSSLMVLFRSSRDDMDFLISLSSTLNSTSNVYFLLDAI